MKYIIINLLAALSYALMSILMQIALDYTNEPTITFTRFFMGFLFLLPIYFISNRPKIKTNVFHIHLFRSILGFSMFLLYTISLNFIPVSNALSLNSTYPFFIPIFLLILYREKIKFLSMLSIVIAFSGIYLIIAPTVNEFLNIGSCLALLSAIFSSASNITIGKLRKTESSFSITFYFFLLSTIFSFVYLLFFDFNFSSELILLLIGIAFFSLLSQQLLSYVLKYLHSSIVSTLMCSSIIFSFLFEWLIFNQEPSTFSILGSLLIIIGCITLLRNN